MSDKSSSGGCFTETLAFLVLVWLLFHLDETLAWLDRLVAT